MIARQRFFPIAQTLLVVVRVPLQMLFAAAMRAAEHDNVERNAEDEQALTFLTRAPE